MEAQWCNQRFRAIIEKMKLGPNCNLIFVTTFSLTYDRTNKYLISTVSLFYYKSNGDLFMNSLANHLIDG